MSNRLELIASFVKNGIGVADVGTDHGYIPVMLVKRGYKGNIIATDINEGPLNKAKQSLIEADCEEAVELILCNGLDGCESEKIDTIIVAGMGGDTITGILDRAEWCAREDIKLILQPVTKPEILRYWLVNNDFRITNEAQAEENGTVYQIICAVPGRDCRYKDSELFIGRYDLIKGSTYYKQMLDKHIIRFSSAAEGLKSTDRVELLPWLGIIENILQELKTMRGINDENC